MDIFQPSKPGAPFIALRNDRYYVFWYDPKSKRTRRASLKTKSLTVAESKAELVYRYAVSNFTTQASEADRLRGRNLTWMEWARKLCRRASGNAKAKGRAYSLTPQYVAALIEVQKGKCAVTGHPLSRMAGYRNPFAPSIDQIEPGKGYTETNVRVVLMIVNTAMNAWGPLPLLQLVQYVANSASLRASPVSNASVQGPDKDNDFKEL